MSKRFAHIYIKSFEAVLDFFFIIKVGSGSDRS